MDIIQLKDDIIIKQGNDLYLFQLNNNKPKFKGVDLSNVIGARYWSSFRKEVTGGKSGSYILCDHSEPDVDLNIHLNSCGSDNRNIEDRNNAQSLTKQELLSMKEEGISSHNIMLKLVQNSTTFNQKTEFAQEKYLRKKANKYASTIQILKPNLRLVTEVLLKQGASQMLGIRQDTLSQILSSLNVRADGTYIVYENNCRGLVIGTILNALNDAGKLINLTTSRYPFDKLTALKVLNHTKRKSFVNVTVESFCKYSNITNFDTTEPMESVEINNVEIEPTVIEGTLKRSLQSDEGNKKTTYIEQQENEVRNLLYNKKADGLVIACKQIPGDLLIGLLQYLEPSSNFVVYCQYQEPLVLLYHDLKGRSDVIYVRIFENWYRSYQVLPDRTHPEITMSATGGYLLTGIYVLNE